MFSLEQLQQMDSEYFNIIVADCKDVTIQSKNTGHYWYLHCTEYPMNESCIIFHKHRCNHPYHQHGKAGTLKQAIKSIKAHDVFQLKVRRMA